MADNGEIKVKSLKRAIEVLNCFIEKQPLGVTEISEKLGIYKSSVHSILTTLQALDYVEQDEDSGKYWIGTGALMLTRAVEAKYSFYKIASGHLQDISEQVGENVYLTIPVKGAVYYLDSARPSKNNKFSVGSMKNSTEYLHCTSSGKAMLAYMPEDEISAYLSKPLQKMTPHTITDPDTLRHELEEIRRRGYSIDDRECDLATKCVAVPIRAADGRPLAALSISGPAHRFTDEKIQEYSEILRYRTEEIRYNM